MNFYSKTVVYIAFILSLLVTAEASAQSAVSYGRVTAVRTVNLENQGASTTGALIGGALGVASGSGQSRSNRALRGVGGAAVGGRVAGAAGSSTGFEYTVLIDGTNTIRIITEQSGMRVGDCVSIQRGQFSNIRLADDARCDTAAADLAEANACATAKQQVLDANTDQEFDRAERRMRLLCGY